MIYLIASILIIGVSLIIINNISYKKACKHKDKLYIEKSISNLRLSYCICIIGMILLILSFFV